MSANEPRPRRSGGSSILLLAVLVLTVMMLVPTVQQLIEQRQHIAELESAIDATTQQIDDANALVDRWQDPAFIRSQARGRLLFVEPGDTTYVVIDDGTLAQAHAEPDISSELHETRADPTELFLDSLLRASAPQPAGSAR